MAERIIQTSFSGGEIAPALYGHVDLDKYKSGVALARNFFLDYHGGMSNRAGTKFIGAAKVGGGITWETPIRLIPFVYSSTTSYVCEFGDLYVRFITDQTYLLSGGTPYEIVSPYSASELAALKFDQSADTLILVHPNHPPYQLVRTTSTTFTLTAVDFSPTVGRPADVVITQVNEIDVKSAYSYVVTAVNDKGEESEQSIWAFQVGSILDQTRWIANKIKWTAVAGAAKYRVYKAGPWPAPIANTHYTPASTTFGYVGDAYTNSFVDNNIAPDYSQAPPNITDPVSPGQIKQVIVSAGGTGYTFGTDPWYVNLIFTGGGGTGAEGIGIVDNETGEVVGVVMFQFGSGYTSAPAVTDDGANTATYTVELGPTSGTYPSCVGFGQQRLWLGATDNLPESFTCSQTGAYFNFNTNPILLDSDAITANLAGRQVNAIKSIFAMSSGMVMLTSGGAFLITGGGQGSAITPSDIVALPQASSGANDLPPLVINYDFLYGQARGNVIRDCAFNFYTQNYTGTDRSVLSSHLFAGYSLKEWCWAEEPFRQVLAVRNDGRILAFTYVPEQELYAWTHYDTQGLFQSICSIPEGNINAVYVVVTRHLDGQDPCWVNYIERLDPRQFDCLLEAWFLDCATQHTLGTIDSNIYLSGTSGSVTIYGYDPCTGAPGGNGPFYQPFGQITVSTTGSNSVAIPVGWTQVTVHALAGGGAASGAGVNWSGGGGGGGQMAWDTIAVTGGTSYNLHVGVGGGTVGTPSAPGTADSWFSTPTILFAQGGGAPQGFGIGGQGGTYNASGTWSRSNGGVGGTPLSSSDGGGGGGGGAGGPSGPGGAAGANSSGFSATDTGGSGGGGADNGTDGGANNAANGAGGAGGNSGAGGAGGAAGTQPNGAGGNGTNGGGGGGGGGGDGTHNGAPGGNGSSEDLWDGLGPGGGGGGGGGPWSQSGANGGNGGYGGGAGGPGAGNHGSPVGGTPGNGFVVITQTGGSNYNVAPNDIIQIGCGKILITGITDSFTLTGTVISTIDATIPDDPNGATLPIYSGDWTVTTPITVVTGLSYLEGKEVWALADGAVQGPFTVAAGQITLTTAATNVIVGLLYTSQLQSLPLDIGEPTIQGKRKLEPAINLKIDKTIGIEIGTSFGANMVPMKQCADALTSDTIRTIIDGKWTVLGQFCVEQPQPLPVSVLAFIPEVTGGDTAK